MSENVFYFYKFFPPSQALGARLFSSFRRGEDDESWQRKSVSFLHDGGYAHAHLSHLEHLVLQLESQQEHLHTQLASAYLDMIEKGGDGRSVSELKDKFRSLVVW